MAEMLGPTVTHATIVLKPHEGRARARFYEAGAVIAERTTSDGDTELEVAMPSLSFERLCRAEGLDAAAITVVFIMLVVGVSMLRFLSLKKNGASA